MGDDNGMISGVVVGGCNDGPVTLTVNGQEAVLPLSVPEGTYTVRAEDACGNVDEETINIRPPDPITLTGTEEIDCSDFGDNNGSIQFTFAGGAGAYSLTPSAGDANGTIVENLPPGLFDVGVEDENGCQAFFEDIESEECPVNLDCVGASIISPNGDGVNDAFVIGCLQRGRNQPNFLGMYDRWGQLVWEQDNYDNSWTGTDLDGTDLDEGGYMWVLRVQNQDGGTEIFRGTVTLLRSF